MGELEPEMAEALRAHHAASVIEREFREHRETRRRWDLIRKAWDVQLPAILAGGRVDPYFLDFDRTPIEEIAWFWIRGLGVPMYMQIPVAGVFVDFGDPRLKIGLELDGKAYHDAAVDEVRDRRLWQLGWRIYRVPGRETMPPPESYLSGDFDGLYEPRSGPWYDALYEWATGWCEGVVWALNVMYYRGTQDKRLKDIAHEALAFHTRIEFPIELEGRAA